MALANSYTLIMKDNKISFKKLQNFKKKNLYKIFHTNIHNYALCLLPALLNDPKELKI